MIPGELLHPFTLSTEDFRAIAKLVGERTGIVLGETKRDLVYGRLGRRLRALSLTSFAQYLDMLKGPGADDELVHLINAITTNLTGFFREPHHFETLANEVLAPLAKPAAGAAPLRIWSAGCSSGEEPHSIAMTVRRALPAHRDALILATDIDTNMVAHGRAGRYDTAKAETIPTQMRRFVQRADEDSVEMAPELRQLIRFKPLNLLQPWPMRGKFDVIFCRNVVIYFDKKTKHDLFDRYADILKPDGWLFIGHSESLFRVSDRFRHLGRTAYRKIQ